MASNLKSDQQVKNLRESTKLFRGIEKSLKGHETTKSLDELIEKLHVLFQSDQVNIGLVQHVLMTYDSNEIEWQKFAKFDADRYTRNLVDSGNGRFNLILLCWGPGQGSAIHDHANSHCFMKMLKGSLSEIKYEMPHNVVDAGNSGELIGNVAAAEGKIDMTEISRNVLNHNEMCYINDNIGLHCVKNSSETEPAVSLHLYCPPYNKCSVFSKTGVKSECEVTFYTINGKKVGDY